MPSDIILHKDNDRLEEISTYRENAIEFLKNHYSLQQTDCEDIVHDSIILLYENVKDGKLTTLSSSLYTYFVGICKNKARELMRKKMKMISTPYEVNIVPENSILDEQVEKILLLESESKSLQQKKEALAREIVCNLPSPCNELLWGFYRDGYSMKTLAEMYHYASVNTVKVTKFRCAEKFRKKYKELIMLYKIE